MNDLLIYNWFHVYYILCNNWESMHGVIGLQDILQITKTNKLSNNDFYYFFLYTEHRHSMWMKLEPDSVVGDRWTILWRSIGFKKQTLPYHHHHHPPPPPLSSSHLLHLNTTTTITTTTINHQQQKSTTKTSTINSSDHPGESSDCTLKKLRVYRPYAEYIIVDVFPPVSSSKFRVNSLI